MNKNNIKYILFVIIIIALIGGFINLSKSDETSVAEANIVNNIKYNNIYSNKSISDTNNDIKTNTVSNNNVTYKSSENKINNSTVEQSNKSENINKKTTTSSKTSTSSSSKSTTTTSKPSNTNISTNDKNSKTVWIGNTGTKYHRESCGTLKGKGHKITLKEAIAEGREPCKVCKP